MIFRVYVTPSARMDLEDAKSFYAQMSPALGNYCQDALLTDISSLQFYAGIHSRHFGYYRLLARRFPFAIYYQTSGDRAVVAAVLDTRRNPNALKMRLTQKSGL